MDNPLVANDRRGPSNRQGHDYALEAERMPPPPCEIIDVHAHIGGPKSARLYARAAALFGITRVYSMTQLEAVPDVKEALGDLVRFNAVPDWSNPDRMEAMGRDFLHRIERFREHGAGIVKLFAAPSSPFRGTPDPSRPDQQPTTCTNCPRRSAKLSSV